MGPARCVGWAFFPLDEQLGLLGGGVTPRGEETLARWEAPQAPAGADKQTMSGDGAFVLLVGGEWVEVKTLTIGEVTRNSRGEVCIQQVSSCSRLADAERFAEATLVE